MLVLIPIAIILIVFICIVVYFTTRHGSSDSSKWYGHRYFAPNEDIGKQGEKIVAQILARNATENDRIFNDIMLTNPQNGMSTQIDHVFISTKGIFVIETKNYSGKIYGDDSRHEWTQYLNNGDVENKFHSPVKQNRTHIYVVSKILQTNFPIVNIIIFVQGNVEHINSEYVYTPKSFESFLKNTSEYLAVQDIKLLSEKLTQATNTSTTNYEHIQNTQTLQAKIANNICPRCNAKLVLRNGKYGKFYGCSNYPKCKFTKEL